MTTPADLDFTRKINKIAAKVEKQSYKKLSFLMIGCSALLFTGYTGSNAILDNIKQGNVTSQQKEKLLVQQIKKMDEKEFTNMLEYISKNVSMYEAKVSYVQHIIVRAKEEEIYNTVSTDNAEELGHYLTQYKQQIKEDVSKLVQVRNSVSNDINVEKEDVEMFFSYMSAYKAKLVISDERIELSLHNVIYDGGSGNHEYNKKNNVYEKIKEFDQELKNFSFIGTPTPELAPKPATPKI